MAVKLEREKMYKIRLIFIDLIITGLILLNTPPGIAQPRGVYISGGHVHTSLMYYPGEEKYEYVGTPYLNKDFMYGKIIMKDDTVLEGLFRYNIYNQEVVAVFDGDTLAVAKPLNMVEFQMAAKRFIYTLIIDRDMGKPYVTGSFFEILEDGELQLLKRHYSKLETFKYASNYMGGAGDGRDYFEHVSELYFRKGPGSEARQLKKPKKIIPEVMEDKKEEVMHFIREEKLSLKDEGDLIRLFEYYNQL